MRKKIMAIIMVIILVSCSYSFFAIRAATLGEQQQEVQQRRDEAEQKLEYVQNELSASVVKIQELDDTIKQAEADLSSLETELSELQVQIDGATESLNKIQEKYDKNEELLRQRIVVMYEVGETTYLDILLGSANIIDFISNYYTIQEFLNRDIELLDEIEQQKNEAEKIKLELDEKKASLKVKKAKKEQLAVITENNKTLKEQTIASLSQEEIDLQQKIEEYKEEEARIENLIRLATNGYEYTGDYTGGVMAWPIAKSGTYITSGYGTRQHPIQGIIKQHTGIDIGNAGFGAPVIAAADGVVTMAGWYGGYGNCVMINHGNGISTLYGHGQTILTEVGKEVKKGDLIMEVGSTGNSTGPHLHFEVRVNGSCTNPMPYLTGETSKENNTENTAKENNNAETQN